MATHRLRQVTWNIPDVLYKRFRELQAWSRTVNMLGVPESEQDWAVIMLDDAVSRGEKVKRAYEKSKDSKLILDPFENARKSNELIYVPGETEPGS